MFEMEFVLLGLFDKLHYNSIVFDMVYWWRDNVKTSTGTADQHVGRE